MARKSKAKPSWIVRIFKWGLGFVAALYVFWIGALVALKWVNPPTTGVRIQRRIEAKLAGKRYRPRQKFVPLDKIAPELQHAVLAAEDGHFYKHHGIDWGQVKEVAEESRETGVVRRGASTVTQQLVKNLFFTTYRDPVRKAFEYTLAPLADTILGKRRVLELYLNEIEWGQGIWGIGAAADVYYHTTPDKLDLDQAARLAACIPSPRRRKPQQMDDGSARIIGRMHEFGW